MSSLYVKPAVEGSIVRQPHRSFKPLPPHGAMVPKTVYWARRLKDVSVVKTTKADIEKAEAAIKKAAEAAARAEAEAASKDTAAEKTSAKTTGAK